MKNVLQTWQYHDNDRKIEHNHSGPDLVKAFPVEMVPQAGLNQIL